MLKKQYLFSLIILSTIFSGCLHKNGNIETPVKTKKEIIIVKKEIKKVPKITKKKVISYKLCKQHKKIMNYASNYIHNEFQKGYFQEKDIIGAKAQLFLIKNSSPTIFAKNINNAVNSYNTQYKLAKKNKCNIKQFKVHPIKKIKKVITTLEKNLKDKK